MHSIYSTNSVSTSLGKPEKPIIMDAPIDEDQPRQSFCTWFHSLKVQIWIAWLGISAGIMAGTVFAIQYQNWIAVTMCFTSSVFATIVLHLHMGFKKTEMAGWSGNRLKCLATVGALTAVFSFIAMIYSLIYAGITHQTIDKAGLKGANMWISAVWFFMTFKWASLTCRFARKYRAYCDEYTPILSSPPEYAAVI